MAATPAMVLVPTSGIARDGRIYVNSRGGFTIEVYSRTGNLESRVAGAVVRTPFTAEDFEVWLKREIREATAKGSIEWAKALTDNGRWVGHADFIPTLGRIIPSAGGKFFVERTDLKASNTDQQASHTIWDLVDLERGLLGRLETPTGLVLTDFEWPYVVVMHRSAAVASVSRYRVVVE